MRKKISLLLVACFVVINVPFASAQSDTVISETVKIISYNLTANNHVIEYALASGTLISKDGLVLTNHHVVMDGNDEPFETFAVCAVTSTQAKPDCLYTASLIAKKQSTDMALLQINSKDVLGNKIPDFPFLNYTKNSLPEIGDAIEVSGFPGIGGETLTKTEGKVSGYEEKEGITHLKTDTTISAGNSGGTAKNKAGVFIGVPSYLRSNISSLGYIIPLVEVEDWITENLEKKPQTNKVADSLLQALLKTKYETEKSEKYSSPFYPFYSIDISDEWEIVFMNDVNLNFKKQVEGQQIELEIMTEILPYEVTDDFVDYLLKRIEKYKSYYTNYKRESVKLFGHDAIKITYDYVNHRNYYFLFSFDNVLLTYFYQLPLSDLEMREDAIEDLLSTLSFDSEKNNNVHSYQQTFSQSNPSVSLNTSGDFYIIPVFDSQENNTIVNIYNPNSFEQTFFLKEQYLEKDSWDLSIEDIAKADIKQDRYRNPNFKLINSYYDVTLDGLDGYAYTYSYQGEDYNQTRKQTNVVVLNGKKYFRFVYDDLEDDYEKNITNVIQTLKSFQYDGEENTTTKGKYALPAFQELFTDIKYHLYEKQITTLVDKEILPKTGKYFFPESDMTRIDALEAILNAKIYVEEERGQTDAQDEIEASSKESTFQDLDDSYAKLTNYAISENIISQGDYFAPERGVTLAETLKILCNTFELPVWDPPYRIDWYLPYMYKGITLGVVSSTSSYDTVLTKGQFANLLYNFLQIVSEQNDF